MSLVRDERADLADFLTTLTAQQWEAPSLCSAWRVRDVVAHMISYEELSVGGLVGRFIRAACSRTGSTPSGVAAYADRSPQELIGLVQDHLQPRGLTAGFGGRIALTDGMIHHQDIRRPLRLPRDIPADRLLPALQFALTAPTIGASGGSAGCGWSRPTSTGPPARAPPWKVPPSRSSWPWPWPAGAESLANSQVPAKPPSPIASSLSAPG